jgi:hypothetical protein
MNHSSVMSLSGDGPMTEPLLFFNILSVNTQSLSDKLNEVELMLHQNDIAVFCSSEHWYTDDTKYLATIDGYNCASIFCRSVKARGGVAIFTKEGISYREIDIHDFVLKMTLRLFVFRLVLTI